MDMKKKLPETSIFDAMQLLQSAWSEVSELTIKNCFWKSEISEKSVEQAINEEDDPSKNITADLEETIGELRERLLEEAPEELNATDLSDVDAEHQQMVKNQVTLKSLQKYEVKALMTKIKLILILLFMIQKYPLQKLK